ncbi:hypothetical protein BD770DRAFT_24000 [Pilaira anomala]|nr:hypothetical protein BD770DRAFT_24000 [Pilaira anomala]
MNEDEEEEEGNSPASNIPPNETSLTPSSTDDSYTLTEQNLIPADKTPTIKYYYLSLQEIGRDIRLTKHEMHDDITFEERISLSGIKIPIHKSSIFMSDQVNDFSPSLQKIIKEFNRSIAFDKTMDISSACLESKEQDIACMLWSTSNMIKKKAKELPCALSKKFNYERNNELNFIIKQVSSLIECIVCGSSLNLDWDITSNCYINCDMNVCFNRHDIIISTEDGTEIGTGEVKPYNTCDKLIEIDRSRIVESCKRQLHQRLVNARSTKELSTFGIFINGKHMQLSVLSLSPEGEYTYHIVYDGFLPTTKETYAFMDETLMTLIQFVRLMENSLPSPEERNDELILPQFSSVLKPTVYMINEE